MTISKVFKYALLLSIILILSFVAFNWKNILRLQTVSTLFDADKIVYNFSNMKEAFLYNQLESSPKAYAFDEEIEPLPNNIKINGEKYCFR